MMPYLTSEWGNPSSSYKFGAKLKSVIETAREQVAELIGAHARDVIFTSCATENNNAAIAAALRSTGVPPVIGQSQDDGPRAGRPCYEKRHIVTSQVEHSSVLNYCMALEAETGSTTPAQRAAPPQLRRGAFGNSPPGRGGVLEGQGAPRTACEGAPRTACGGGPCRVTYLPVDRDGLLKLADLEAAITDQTAVVSLMWANRIGTSRLMKNSNGNP